MIQDTDHITVLELTQTEDSTRRMSAEALLSARVMQQYLGDLDFLVKWDMVEGSSDEGRELIAETQEHLTVLRNALIEQVSVNAGLLAAMRALVRQRDRALDDRLSHDDLADLVADHQFCAQQDALKLISVLLSSDADLLASDLVLDHNWLTSVRDAISDVIREVDQLVE